MLVGSMYHAEAVQLALEFSNKPGWKGYFRVKVNIGKSVTAIKVSPSTIVNTNELSIGSEEATQELIITQNQWKIDQLDIETLGERAVVHILANVASGRIGGTLVMIKEPTFQGDTFEGRRWHADQKTGIRINGNHLGSGTEASVEDRTQNVNRPIPGGHLKGDMQTGLS